MLRTKLLFECPLLDSKRFQIGVKGLVLVSQDLSLFLEIIKPSVLSRN